MRTFARKYPNVSVNYKTVEAHEYYIQLKTKLSAGDKDIDIFMIYVNIIDPS